MVEPGTAMLITSAIASAAKGAGEYLGNESQKKQSKRRAKETKRETQAGLLEDALQRSAELEAHKLSSRQKLGKRKAHNLNDTASLVRGALNI